ncbi:MAG: hypothetical protein AAB941_02140 [Patescibacteria group bacterium]
MENQNENFVYIDEYGLLGSNFYWSKGIEIDLPKEMLKRVGLEDERVLVHKDLITPLQNADKKLQEKGDRVFITEGYRSNDVALWRDGKKLILHNKEDGINGYFIDFYKEGKKKNEQYQKLQEFLIKTMQDNGFRVGIKREYFHFNYAPSLLEVINLKE